MITFISRLIGATNRLTSGERLHKESREQEALERGLVEELEQLIAIIRREGPTRTLIPGPICFLMLKQK
jgi:hypothetical protein